MHSWCVESEKWVEICFHHWTSEKIPFLYFFLHKSWIWQTLGHVTKKFSYCHFHNAPKECFWQKKKKKSNFMHGFKSAILEKLKNCQTRWGSLIWFKSSWHQIRRTLKGGWAFLTQTQALYLVLQDSLDLCMSVWYIFFWISFVMYLYICRYRDSSNRTVFGTKKKPS